MRMAVQMVYFYPQSIERVNQFIINTYLMQEECLICNIEFDAKVNPPMVLCLQQHICCLACVQKIFDYQYRPTCPECRQELTRRDIVKFRLFEKYQEKIKQINQRSQEQQKFKQIQMEQLRKKVIKEHSLLIRDIMFIKQEDQGKHFRAFIKVKVEYYLKENNYQMAITLLQNTIQKFPVSRQQTFVGIGSKQQEFQFCENSDFEWYKNYYNPLSISLEDILALMFLRRPNYKEQRAWYHRLAMKYINNMKILLGLAITQHNRGNQQVACNLYLRIIKQNPNFYKTYLLIAFIYLKKKDYHLAHNYASQCLRLSPNNIYALYVTALTSQFWNHQQTRIKLIKILIQKPNFKRAYSSLQSILSMQFKDKNLQIIKSFSRKIIQNSQQMYQSKFRNAKYQYQIGNLQQSKKMFLQLISNFRPQLSNMYETYCSFLGCIYFQLGDYRESLIYFHFSKSSLKQLLIGISEFQLERYEQAIESLQRYVQVGHFQGQQLLKQAYKMLMYCSRRKQKYDQAQLWYKKWTHKQFGKKRFKEGSDLLNYWKQIFTQRQPEQTQIILSKLYEMDKYYCFLTYNPYNPSGNLKQRRWAQLQDKMNELMNDSF